MPQQIKSKMTQNFAHFDPLPHFSQINSTEKAAHNGVGCGRPVCRGCMRGTQTNVCMEEAWVDEINCRWEFFSPRQHRSIICHDVSKPNDDSSVRMTKYVIDLTHGTVRLPCMPYDCGTSAADSGQATECHATIFETRALSARGGTDMLDPGLVNTPFTCPARRERMRCGWPRASGLEQSP